MKERLDVLLIARGLAPSREQAKALIMEGQVYVDGQREDKAGASFEDTAAIEVRGDGLPYVSRGGRKLERALDECSIDVADQICMDVGASTGGFTDCMLQRGAARVYAIDVGYGQFAWKLRQDPRVVCMEKTNIRYVTPEQIPEPIAFASVDVSFISLTKVLDPIRALMADEAEAVVLIKPQFEAGREQVGKKGVVRDPAVHREVIQSVVTYAREHGWAPLHLTHSPIKGPEGNIEYLLHLRRTEDMGKGSGPNVAAAVEAAHEALDKRS